MKLVFCPVCQDIFKLSSSARICHCGASSGKCLKNGLNVEIAGKAIPLGFDNYSLAKAIRNRPENDDKGGERFEAFVIPKNCKTVKEGK